MAKLITGSTNFTKVEKYFKNIQDDYPKIKESILSVSQKLLLQNLQRLAPRNTGAYANSWKLGPITEEGASITTPMGNLFIILEFTGALPSKRKRSKGEKPYVFTDKSGNTVFTMTINNPGFKKIPHAQPALDLTMKAIPDIMKKELEKIF